MSRRDPPLSRAGEGRRRYDRALRVGLAVSVVLHLLVLLITGRVDVPAARFESAPLETEPAPDALVVVEVDVTGAPEEPDEPRPEPGVEQPAAETPERDPPEVVPVPLQPAPRPTTEEDEAPPPARPVPNFDPLADRDNVERLTPQFVDARIWVDPTAPGLIGRRLERFARADSAVRAILRDWLDSLVLTEQQRQAATDWTFEKDGKRYGISPQGLHLGDITIPIPFGFAASGPQRRAWEQALRDLREIQWYDIRADVEEARDDRREAMRERSEEEVRRRSSDTTGVRRE